MSRIFPYNCEKHSVIDIISFLRERKYDVELVPNEKGGDKFHILGTEVFVDVPIVMRGGQILMDVRFETYPQKENYNESQTVYKMLWRKFHLIEKDAWPTRIKDEEEINKIANIRKFS